MWSRRWGGDGLGIRGRGREDHSACFKRLVLRVVGGMTVAIVNDNFKEIERRYSVQACGIDTQLSRVRAPFVMRIDAAVLTEMVLCGAGIETVSGNILSSVNHPKAALG